MTKKLLSTCRFSLGFLLLLLLVINACDKDDNTCEYSFDQRACNFDVWAKSISSSDIMAKKDAVQKYIKEQGINLLEIKVKDPYHEVVCEACGVCPEQHRFFVKIPSDQAKIIESIDLFNLKIESCQ